MRKLLLLIGALLFSTLFYQKSIGLNLSLFTVLSIAIVALCNPEKIKNSQTLYKAIAFFITGSMVFLFKSDLTIIANVIAFFTFIGSTSENKSSIYVQWINGVYTSVVSVFSIYYDSLNLEVKNVKKKEINYVFWLKFIGIPLVVLIIFISLYRAGNPKFDALISRIDLSFLNVNWILFAGLGYYLFNNITRPIQIEPLTKTDIETENNLEKNNSVEVSSTTLKNETQLGVVLMVLLNILITIFLITDFLHLSELHSMVAPELSKQVHTGVNALIASNLLAIVIILYFFRGNLNFFQGNKVLKKLTFVWILLNITVVLITAIKNVEYIVSFGLTYKRIGVLVFLTITSIGLITTFIKVSKIKNLWYLFRKNMQVAFVLLLISSTINWDKMITAYNINYAEQIDLNYLIDLSNNNTFLLKDYIEKKEVSSYFERRINFKHYDYMRLLKGATWQEMTFDNFKVSQ